MFCYNVHQSQRKENCQVYAKLAGLNGTLAMKCFMSFTNTFVYIWKLLWILASAHAELNLNDCTWEWDSESKVKVQGLLLVITEYNDIPYS